MASKDVIETNKLKIGSGSTKGLYVGSAESKYAVLSDSAKSQTVIYDKVHYDFTVTDLSTTVPASGGTYTISASQSTRTHGNGTVDAVTFSPTSVTIPANTGSSYSSAVTVTQTTSNLTDNYNFSVAGDAVKSIVLTLSNPAVIPASGGSVSSCTTSATVTYNSGRQITTFTPTKIQWGTAVSAGTKGTTVSSQNSAGTLTCYVEYGGVRSNTASITVNQAANAVTSSGLTEVGCTSPTNNSSLGEIAAGGGSKTPTLTATGGTAWTAYTSTSTASTTPSKTWSVAFTNSGNFTLKSSTTGQISASTKGTTMSNVTTSNTATATVTVTANGVTRTASTKYHVTQAFNHIVSATATTSSTGTHISYANIGPATTSAAPTKNGACTLTYSSGSNSKVTSNPTGASIAWNRTYTLASSQNGFTAVNTSGTLTATSLGTTISNARTSAVVTSVLTPVITHTADYGGSVVSATSMTCQVTCTQNGNYVTGITVANQALSIAEIHASGGTKTDTGSDGTVTYKFTTGQSTTTKPGDTYGSLTTTTSYSMTASGRFTLTDAVNGTVSATTKGTSVEGVTSSNTITKTVNHSWAHSTTYSAGGTVTTSGTTTGKATQGKNEITGYTGHSGLTSMSISASKVPAGGGTSTITWAGTASATRKPVYTSTATGSSVSYTPTVSTAVTGNSTVASKGVTISNETTAIATVTGYYWADGLTASTTTSVKQDGNYVTGLTATDPTLTIAQIAAGGGSKTDTGGAGTLTFKFTSGSSTGTTPANTYGTLTTTKNYTIASTSNGFSVANATTGAVSAESKGTTISNVTTSDTITKTVTYTWTPTASYNSAGEKTVTKTKTGTATQAGNYVSSLTYTTNPTVVYSDAIPASGGTKSDSGTLGAIKVTYTSTSTGTTFPASTFGTSAVTSTYSMTSGNGFTIATGTGVVSATSKGTTDSNTTTSNTVTKTVTYTWTPTSGYNAGGSKTVSKDATGTATQGANSHSNAWNNPVVTFTYPSGKIAAGGGSKTPTVSATQSGVATFTSTATASTSNTSFTYSYSMPTTSGFSLNISTGVVSADNRTTALGNDRSSGTITATATGAGSKTGTKTATVTQEANYVVSIAASGTSTNGAHFSYANVAASATTAPVTLNGNAKYTYTSGSVGSSAPTAGTATYSRTYSLASTTNGFTAVNTAGTLTCTARGTEIGTARTSSNVTSVLTVTYTHPTGISGGTVTSPTYSKTNTCTQEGNYVTAITVASQAIAYETIPAGGGSKTPTGSNGTVTYKFSSNSTSTTKPGATYGELTSSVSYSMTESGRFTKGTNFASNGTVSASTKGTTIENVTSSDTITKTVSYTWTPTASYNAAGTKTVSGTATGKTAQAANYVTSLTIATNPAITYANAIPAGGGTTDPSGSNGSVSYNFTSGSNSSTAPGSTYGSATTTTAYSMATGGDSRITLKSTSTGQLSGTSKGSTVVGVTSSGTVTKTVTYKWVHSTTYNGGGTVTKTNTATGVGTQAENKIEDAKYNEGNSAWTATISIGNGMTAAGGSATVTHSAGHTHYWQQKYTSGTYVADPYTSAVTDTSTIAITSNGNNRFSLSGNTLNHSNMTTNVATDSVTVKVTNASNTGTTNTASKSITNQIEATKYDEGNSAWTATISIGTGITAAGGSAAVTSSAGHVHYWRQKYTSGSYVSSWYTSAVTDTANVTEDSDPNNRFSYSNGTLTHSTMGTNATTDSCTLRVRNASNTATTNTASTSVTNQIESTKYNEGNSAWTATISIGTGIHASGGTATVTSSASHIHYWQQKYTSGSFVASSYTSTVTDTANVTEDSDPNNRFSYSNGTLTHSTMGTNVTTDSCTLRVRNAANTGTTNTASVSATNAITGYADYQTPSGVTISSSIVPASGGTSTITFSPNTCSQNAKAVYTSKATASTYTTLTGVAYTTSVAGNTSVATKGTTPSNQTTAIATVTGTYTANGKSSTTTTSVKQAANYVTLVEASGISGSNHFYYDNINPSATTVSAVMNGGSYYTFTSGERTFDGTSSPSFGGSASYTRSNYRWASASGNGFSAVNSSTGALTHSPVTTTLSNAVTSPQVKGDLKVVYTHASGISGGTVSSDTFTSTVTCTMNGNYVTGITANTAPTITYSTFAAFGGTQTAGGTSGTCKYGFTSGSSSSTKPNGVTLSVSSNTYACSSIGTGFSKGTSFTSDGSVTAEDRGTTTGNARSTGTITRTVKYKCVHGTDYSAGGTVTCSTTCNTTASQEANSGTTTWGNVTISTFSYAQIPASGGTKSPSVTVSQSGTINYTSGASTGTTGSVSKSFSFVSGDTSIKSASTFTSDGKVSADTRGDVTGNALTRTVKLTATGQGSKSATANTTVTLQANTLTRSGGTVTISSFSYPTLPASGGTTSSMIPTVSATQPVRNTYTSGASADTTNNSEFTITYGKNGTLSETWVKSASTYTSTGQISCSTRSTTTGDSRTTSSSWFKVTVKGISAGTTTKSASTTCNVTQEGNYLTKTWDTPTVSTFSYATIPASGDTVTPTVSATQSGTYSYTSGSSGSTSNTPTSKTFALLNSGTDYSNIASASTFTSTGKVSASTRGTTTGAAQTRYIKVTVTGESSKSATASTYVTRQKNEVTGYTDYQNPSGLSLSCVTLVPASGGSISNSSSNVTWAGTCKQNAKAVYTSNATASSYTNLTISNSDISKSYHSSYLFSNKGTTLSNSTTQASGVVWTYTANGKSTTVGAEVTQAANRITGITSSSNAANYSSTIPASGGTCSDTGSDGSITKYWYTSGSSGSSIPTGTSGGTTGRTTEWSVPSSASSIWSFTDNNGTISAITRGTTYATSTRSVTVTEESTFTYTHHSNYGGGVVTTTSIATGTATQAANTTSATYSTPTVTLSYPSGSISAGGGTKTPTTSATQNKIITYASGSQTEESISPSFSKSYTMTAGNGFTINASTGVVTAENRGNTTGSERTSNNIKLYAWANNVTGSSSNVTVKQQANAVVSTWWDDVEVESFYYPQIPASGGTATPVVGVYDQEGTVTYTSGFVDDDINSNFTFSYSAGNLGYNFVKDSNFATNGKVSASSRGTTPGSYYLGEDVTVTVTGEGGRSTTAEAPVTQQENTATISGGTITSVLFRYPDTIPASGGTTMPSMSMTQNVKLTFTSGAQMNTTATDSPDFTYQYAQYSATTGMSLRTSDGRASGGTRSTTIGPERKLWVSVTGTGYNNVTTTGRMAANQEHNYIVSTTALTNPTLTAVWPTAPSTGGTLTPTSYYMSGGSVKIEYNSTSQGTVSITSSNNGTAYRITTKTTSTPLDTPDWLTITNGTAGTLSISASTSSSSRRGYVNVAGTFGGSSYPTDPSSGFTLVSSNKYIDQEPFGYTVTRSSNPAITLKNNLTYAVQFMYVEIGGANGTNWHELCYVAGNPTVSANGTYNANVSAYSSSAGGCTVVRVNVQCYVQYGSGVASKIQVKWGSTTKTVNLSSTQSNYDVDIDFPISASTDINSLQTFVITIS